MARFSPPLSPRSARSRAATASATSSSTNATSASSSSLHPSLRVPSSSTAASSSSSSQSASSNSSPHSHFSRSKSSSAMADVAPLNVNLNNLNNYGAGPPIASSSSSMQPSSSSPSSSNTKRGRSSSILSIHEIKENYDDALDQSAMANLNADWVNYKGAWLIHIVLIVVGKILVDSIPGIEQDTSWTIVLQGYLLATFIMFHFVEGVPFESNSGVWDRLTMWEQIDGGEQYTPAKKWLTSLPICLFLLSTHYTRYDHHPALFSLNLISLVALALIPKLPQLHRQRLSFGSQETFANGDLSTGANTPVEVSMQRAHLPSLPE